LDPNRLSLAEYIVGTTFFSSVSRTKALRVLETVSSSLTLTVVAGDVPLLEASFSTEHAFDNVDTLSRGTFDATPLFSLL